MASEEIAKANQIILKQSQELHNQKKTIAWRTEVALQQEKAINEKEKLLSIRAEELQHAHDTIQQLREEIPQQLQAMRHFAKELELKYTNRKLNLIIKKLKLKHLYSRTEISTLKEHLSSANGKENLIRKSNRK